jgi:hypothetical protein
MRPGHALLLLFHHAAAQQCAVCFAGNAVGLMQPHVRRFAKERLVDALGCAAVDSFFYLTLDNTQQRDDLLPAPNVTVEAVHAAAREFDPVSVTVHLRDDSLGDDDDDAHAQLSKAAACYALVEASELAARKRYDWVVRTRPDLAWVAAVPPVKSLYEDRVYVSQHSWPVGDAFFVAPGKLAREVFRAVDALGQDSHCDASQVEEIGNAGVVESALHRHLASRKIPTQLYDGFAFVVARWREGGDCRGLKQVHVSACVLAANEGLVSDACQAAVTRPYEEGCRRDFPPLGGEASSAEALDFDDAAWRADAAPKLAKAPFVGQNRVLVVTTAGHDGPALVGQLALCFVGAVRVDNVAKALGALLSDLSDGNLGWTKARKELHDATLDGLWSHHRGTVRCTPACAQADVSPVIEGVGHPLRFAC